jgi:hypothetical protein
MYAPTPIPYPVQLPCSLQQGSSKYINLGCTCAFEHKLSAISVMVSRSLCHAWVGVAGAHQARI